jgi:GntR family transcriptional regulator
MPDVEHVLPAYRQIVRHYTEKIAKGELVPGDKMPSERELVETWKISKATANKVVATLKSEGVVETKVGLGTTVSSLANDLSVGVGPRDMFSRLRQDGKIRLPGEVSVRTTGTAQGADAPDHVVAALGATDMSLLLWRRRVISRNERPFSVALSWFLPAVIEPAGPGITERLLANESIPAGTPKFISEQIGRDLTEATDHLSAISADETLAAELGVEVGSPLLHVLSTIYAEGWPIEVGEYFYPASAGVNYRYDV